MPFSDEELIAYLLGDASPELTARLQQQLPHRSDLLERLSQLRQLLGQIEPLAVVFEPPADLVDTTLARIDSILDESDPSLDEPFDSQDAADSMLPSEVFAPPESGTSQPAVARANQAAQSGLESSFGSDRLARRRAPWDSSALIACLTILCCLALPALLRVRFESRKAQCARNLELTGRELINYAINHPSGRFPVVAIEGPEAFAGVYAGHLREAGLPIESSQLNCASLLGLPASSGLPRLQSRPSGWSDAVPSLGELHRLALHELQWWQHVMGGDYAYNLGVTEQGTPRAPKYEGRSQFAILADAPIIEEAGAQSRLERFIAHEGRGINVFYEDGHVAFVAAQSLQPLVVGTQELIDNPIHNQRGRHELGLHPQDASLAPSGFPPLRK